MTLFCLDIFKKIVNHNGSFISICENKILISNWRIIFERFFPSDFYAESKKKMTNGLKMCTNTVRNCICTGKLKMVLVVPSPCRTQPSKIEIFASHPFTHCPNGLIAFAHRMKCPFHHSLALRSNGKASVSILLVRNLIATVSLNVWATVRT